MDISVDGGLRNDPGSPIELRYLEKLSIREWGDNFSALFPLIHAPLLTQLEYRKRGMGPISSTIIPLLDQAHIHTLITDGQLFETIHFLELLRHTPHLRSVIFKPSCFDDRPCTISMEELLCALTTADDDLAMAYIPELEEFECHVWNDLSTSTLVKFIMNRQTTFTSQKLRSVVVTFPGPRKDISELEGVLPSIVMGEVTVKIRYTSGSQLQDFGSPLGSIQNTLSSHPF
ncbi:hypothetical protein CPB84DRAFT_1798259 [Gymnopilus junonius]|uniref:Uncharacterized protein n=1 Tax=Gymnopilus junonius TaxID=109634 RepID=A0A9P5NBD9_GYMJU|nr:hypothetical protein CPB84DRAFT_1798259 [Gymnopilus junonius]